MYGPVRTVVWEDGGANNPASYPVCALELHALGGLGSVVAVMADEHVLDQPQAEPHRDDRGVTLVRCPNCSANLELTGQSTVVTCTFCNASCRITVQTAESYALRHRRRGSLSRAVRGAQERRGDGVATPDGATCRAAPRHGSSSPDECTPRPK